MIANIFHGPRSG